MEYEPEPHIWEYEDAMRFVSPCTWHTVHHDDGDFTLEGEQCIVEVHDTWVADVKRRVDSLNRAGISTSYLHALLARMESAVDDATLSRGWELFEATLDGMMDDLIEALHAKYDDDAVEP